MLEHRPMWNQRVFLVPRTLIVLCGPAGSGKSTFASDFVLKHQDQGYKETMIVSSDQCRAIVCDDITNQQVNRDTFDLFHYILRKRMYQGRLTIADSTALQVEARGHLLDLAQRYQYQTCLFLFNMSFETCVARDRQANRGRSVGGDVISYHVALLDKVLQDVFQEEWNQIQILDEAHPATDIVISS